MTTHPTPRLLLAEPEKQTNMWVLRTKDGHIVAYVTAQELAENLVTAVNHFEEMKQALRKLLEAYEAVFPGIRYISVPDYALTNEAPIEAKRVLATLDQEGL